MEELYNPPKSSLGGNTKPRRWLKIFTGTVLTLITIFAYWLLGEIVPQFIETFAAFGSELPYLTILTVSAIPLYKWVAYFSEVLYVVFIISTVTNKGFSIVYKSIVWSFVFALVIFVAGFVAMYLPVFTIGQAV